MSASPAPRTPCFQVISEDLCDRNGQHVVVIKWLGTNQHQTIHGADLRTYQARFNEFVPDATTTQYVDGSTVPVVAARKAKCHNFEGGWNGYSFYTDSKGGLYAVKNAS
jgi:hypothetical protein